MNRNTIIIDIQGFQNDKNNFIIKELALATIEYTQVFLVKPPYSYSSLSDSERKNVSWIEKNRGIYWSEGYIDYREFRRIIKPILINKIIYVKGQEKINWIKELCETCTPIDVSEQGCPSLSNLQKKYCSSNLYYNCVNHLKECALKNVICIKKWLFNLSDLE